MRTVIALICLSFICSGDLRIVTLNSLQEGQIVEAYVDEELIIKLSGNKSTGYEWIVKNPNLEDSFAGFNHIKTTYIGKDSFSGPKMGLGGNYFIYLKPNSEGDHTVRLSYERPFNPEHSVNSFEFTISSKLRTIMN